MHTFNSDHSLTLTWIQMQQATARITEFNDSMGARSLPVQKFLDLKVNFLPNLRAFHWSTFGMLELILEKIAEPMSQQFIENLL